MAFSKSLHNEKAHWQDLKDYLVYFIFSASLKSLLLCRYNIEASSKKLPENVKKNWKN